MPESHNFRSLVHGDALATLQQMVLLKIEQSKFRALHEDMDVITNRTMPIQLQSMLGEQGRGLNEVTLAERLESMLRTLEEEEASYRNKLLNPYMREREYLHPDNDIGMMVLLLTLSDNFMERLISGHLLSNDPHRSRLALSIMCLLGPNLHLDIVLDERLFDLLVRLIKEEPNNGAQTNADLKHRAQIDALNLLGQLVVERKIAEKLIDTPGLPRTLLRRFNTLVHEWVLWETESASRGVAGEAECGETSELSAGREGTRVSMKRKHDEDVGGGPVQNNVTSFIVVDPSPGAVSIPVPKRPKFTSRKSDFSSAFKPPPSSPPLNEPIPLAHKKWQDMNPKRTELMNLMTVITGIGEYADVLALAFEESTLSTIFYLLSASPSSYPTSSNSFPPILPPPLDKFMLNELLRMLCSFFAHRRLANDFVQRGGVQCILRVPRNTYLSEGVALCLLGLANISLVMQTVCSLPVETLRQLVKLSLWLISDTAENVGGSKHGVLFLSLAFNFRGFMDIFDQQDGLRALVNLITCLFIPGVTRRGGGDEQDRQNYNDAVVSVLTEHRIIIRNASMALKQYFRVHLAMLAGETRARVAARHTHKGPPFACRPAETPCRPTPTDYASMVENVAFIEDHYAVAFPLLASAALETAPGETVLWRPVARLVGLEAVPVLVQLIDASVRWKTSDLALYVLETLHVACLCPGMHLALVGGKGERESGQVKAGRMDLGLRMRLDGGNVIEENGGEAQHGGSRRVSVALVAKQAKELDGIGLIIHAADGNMHADPEIRKAALEVLCNLVRRQFYFPTAVHGTLSKPRPASQPDAIAQSVWQAVRSNNGIKVLVAALQGSGVTIVHADCVRLLATKCLLGLACDPAIRNILVKLKIPRYISELVREPMLEENDKFHRDFRKYALELIRATTSRNASLPPAIADVATDGMLNKIERASVVQNTNITFSDHELLLVIHRHLQSKGLLQSASVLARESRLQLDEVAVMARTSVRLKTPQKITPVPKSTLAATSANLELPSPLQTPTTKLPAGSSFRVQPRKKSIVHLKFDSAVPRASPPPGMTMSSVGEPAMEREGVKSWTQEASSSGLFHSSSSDRLPTVTLDYVIAEFLRNQHSHCQNPTSVLPPISILEPHRCPEVKLSNVVTAPKNVGQRLLERQAVGGHGGPRGIKMDKSLIFRNFRPVRTYRHLESYDGNESILMCASFSQQASRVIVGDHLGSVHSFNTDTTEIVDSWTLMDGSLWSVKVSRDDRLLLISSAMGGSALWELNDMIYPKMEFPEDKMLLFSNSGASVVGTARNGITRVYSAETGDCVLTLNDPTSSKYKDNVATFNLTDDQILSDGVLWDIRSQTKIHKFDKFTNYAGGSFHPNSNELIIGASIWDLRSFKLLRDIPSLDHAQIQFNHSGEVIYGIVREIAANRRETEGWRQDFGSCFRTFDADDYASIATVECERRVLDLCLEEMDNCIAVVEHGPPPTGCNSPPPDSVVRLYSVGRKRHVQDDSDIDTEDEEGELSQDEGVGGNDDDDDGDEDGNSGGMDTDEENIYTDSESETGSGSTSSIATTEPISGFDDISINSDGTTATATISENGEWLDLEEEGSEGGDVPTSEPRTQLHGVCVHRD